MSSAASPAAVLLPARLALLGALVVAGAWAHAAWLGGWWVPLAAAVALGAGTAVGVLGARRTASDYGHAGLTAAAVGGGYLAACAVAGISLGSWWPVLPALVIGPAITALGLIGQLALLFPGRHARG